MGRVVRGQNRDLQQTGIFSPHSKSPEDQNRRGFFLCRSDKARVRSPMTDFPCPQDLFVHSFVCQFREIRPLGITALLLVGQLKGPPWGKLFPWSERHQAIPQQGTLLDQGCLQLVAMCSFSVSALGIMWGCLLNILKYWKRFQNGGWSCAGGEIRDEDFPKFIFATPM